MVASRYPIRRTQSGRHGLHILEGVFALSVIAGLAFVTVRIMNMPELSNPTVEATSEFDKTAASSPASDASATKTP
jgi:hypothetical protein